MTETSPRTPFPPAPDAPTQTFAGPAGGAGTPSPTFWYGGPADPATPAAPVPPAPSRTPRRPMALVAATALLAGLVGGGAGAATVSLLDEPDALRGGTAAPAGGTPVVLPEGTTAAVAQKVLPSVVQIAVRTAGGGGSGSGVILDADGHILTNNHVIAAAGQGGELRVTLHDGRTAAADIVGTDPGSDLAVIKVENVGNLTPIALGSSDALQVGESVVAVGSPLGLAGTVTEGIVSSKNRPVRTGGADGGEPAVLNAVQTDTAINPGNSGGALVNLRGELVGINTAIATLGGAGGRSGSIGLGFAIPVDQARRVAAELIRDGQASRARLGAEVADAESGGAQLAGIEPGSAAATAGLRAGDVVTRVGGQLVGTADALIAAVRSAEPGSTVAFTVARDGDERVVEVTLDSVPA